MSAKNNGLSVKLNDIFVVIDASFEYYDYAPDIKTTKITIDEDKYIVSKITKKYITISKYQGFAYGRHQFHSIDSIKKDVNTFNLKNSRYGRTRLGAIEKEIKNIPEKINSCKKAIARYKKEKENLEFSLWTEKELDLNIKAEEIFIELYEKRVLNRLKRMLEKEKIKLSKLA